MTPQQHMQMMMMAQALRGGAYGGASSGDSGTALQTGYKVPVGSDPSAQFRNSLGSLMPSDTALQMNMANQFPNTNFSTGSNIPVLNNPSGTLLPNYYK